MKHHGFTLLELMIVVVIIGILAMTAVPLYNGYINEAAHAEVTTTLADIASKEEAFHATWNEYISANDGYTLQKAGERTPQVGSGKGDGTDGWFRLGYNSKAASGDGGLFGGPMYFRYSASANGDSYTICAYRKKVIVAGSEDEFAKISSANRRAVVYGKTTAGCSAPTGG